MYQFRRNILIDGRAFGADRAANTRFMLSSSGSWQAGPSDSSSSAWLFKGAAVPQAHGKEPSGRGYNGVSGVAWKEPQVSLEEQRKQIEESETRHYEDDVQHTLSEIAKKSAGRAVLAEVGRQPRQLTILPYLPSDQDWTNGRTISNAKESTRKRWLVRHSQDNKELGQVQGDPVLDKDGKRKRGTGVGSDVEIEFITPELAHLVNRNPPIAVKSNWTEGNERHTLGFADEILVHELVHAMRDMAGLSANRRVPRQPRYGTIEEFFAIVVANVYRAEFAERLGVRNSNHGKWETMYCGGDNFLKIEFNRRHLRQFRRQHSLLCEDLRRIDVYFNPFRHMAASLAF
jgi:hypothetical protein